MKHLYCIRHGTALHNINFKTMGDKAYTNFPDTPLVDRGIKDAIYLERTWEQIPKIDLVVVSPLSRTLQTADTIFRLHNKPIVVLDDLIEYKQSEHICNFRKNTSMLKKIYPNMDFSQIKTDEPPYWSDIKRTIEEEITLLKDRISKFKEWIKERPERNIAVVGHSAYFNMMLNNFSETEYTELKHCYPYEYNL